MAKSLTVRADFGRTIRVSSDTEGFSLCLSPLISTGKYGDSRMLYSETRKQGGNTYCSGKYPSLSNHRATSDLSSCEASSFVSWKCLPGVDIVQTPHANG